MLGGLTQQRISQLVKQGLLVAEMDSGGRYKYDRETAERLARNRAARAALSVEEAEERKVLQAEARDRFRRQREREMAEEKARIEKLDSLCERAVDALEKIAKGLEQWR